jgi:hypothetical protein
VNINKCCNWEKDPSIFFGWKMGEVQFTEKGYEGINKFVRYAPRRFEWRKPTQT